MEKEFIPYEQALALKELGFDEKCLAGFYTYVDENFVLGKYDYRGKFNINYSDEDDYIVNTDKTHYISAPIFSQAFRFFREKYGLLSRITYKNDKYKFEYQYKSSANNLYTTEYKTYEEAEFECLKKLIEIVKNK